jgi:glycosyltransferase involved in cell wall biosynthesis
MHQSFTLDIVVPCYQPPVGWAKNLVEAYREFSAHSKSSLVCLILVDDGTDPPLEGQDLDFVKAQIPRFQQIRHTVNRGKGAALRTGVARSESDLILLTDIDFPYTLESMLAVERQLAESGGIALGFRDQQYYRDVPAFRKHLSRLLRWMVRRLLGVRHNDSQCGLKGFSQPGKAIFLQTTIERYLFDLEFLLLARSMAALHAVPVRLRPGVQFRAVGGRILWQETLNFLRILLRRYKS